MAQQIVILNFQDPSGSPLANGKATFRLQFDISDAVASGPQVAAGRLVTADLDSNGTCSVLLWANDDASPANSIYFVTAYSSGGAPVWEGELTVGANTANYLLQEDGTSLFLLEGSTIDAILLEP